MYFLINKKKKIIFGWSAKAGCTHIKNLFYFFENGKHGNKIHTKSDINKLPDDYQTYKIILFIRNPFERLISGFLDKYKDTGEFNHMWKNNTKLPLTFTNFVNALSEKNFKLVQFHHFTPQLSEEFNPKIFDHKDLIIYDIKNIDYKYLEKIFNVKITDEVRNFYGYHTYKATEIITYDVYDLLIKDYINYKPLTHCFYNKDLLMKVYTFYQDDFEYFSKKKHYYTIY